MFPLCNVFNAAAFSRKEQGKRAHEMMFCSYFGSAMGILVASGAYALGEQISISNLVLSTVTLPGWICGEYSVGGHLDYIGSRI